MLATKVICPHCAKHLKAAKPLTVGHRVLCSRCGRSFAVRPDMVAAPEGVDASPLAGSIRGADAPPPAPPPSFLAAPARPAVEAAPSPAPKRQALWIGVILGGLLLVMGATTGLVAFLATRQAATSAPGKSDSRTSVPPPPDGSRLPPSPGEGDPPSRATPEPERVAWLPPEEQEQVNKAIDRGVEWLKQRQGGNGSWNRGLHAVGLSALPALTLLECGVPPDDSRVQKAAGRIRQAIPNLIQTYEIALVILFLDRLGDPEDEKRIQTCALRLVAGQSRTGGWTYQCPRLSPENETDLLQVMEQTRPKSSMDLFVPGPDGSAPPGFMMQKPGGASLDKGIQGDSPESKLLPSDGPAPLDKNRTDPEVFKKALTQLPAHLRNIPALQPPEQAHKLPSGDGTDNSNTQFAILGLSAAQRHQLPLQRALALIVRRFRTSQWPGGRWGYHYSAPPRPDASTPAMTGAGLLGLAVGLGLAADHVQPQAGGERFEDPAIEKAFGFLGRAVGKGLGAKRPRARGRNRAPINMYFMWTLERCGVLFNRRAIDGKDWYQWGSELLVENQNEDGSWMAGGYPGSAPITDTCFALLFLKRANLAKDLTKKLEFFMEGKKLQGP